MDPRRYRTFAEGWRGKALGGLEAEAIGHIRRLGMVDNDNVRDLADLAGDASRRGLVGGPLDPTDLDNVALAVNAHAARGVERMLRGPLFVDVFVRTGGDVEAALDAVTKYHFDYSDLSRFETHAKRAVPFYVWTRRNFPLQLEQMVRRPGKYTRYLHLKRNLEMGVPEYEDVPSYYADLLAIRTPFAGVDLPLLPKAEGRIYLTPDLPFVGLAETLDRGQLLSQLNPLIKTPLESGGDKQFFSGVPFNDRLVEAPASWSWLLLPLSAARGLPYVPKVHRGANGELLMSDREAYKIEQMLPLLGRLRRLLPNERRYQTRATTSWLSFASGLGFRTLDESTKLGEVARQIEKLERAQTRQVELGR